MFVMILYFFRDVTGALLCVTSYPGESVLATGSFCRAVILFDPREGRSPIASHRQHTRAVMAIVMNSNYVLSASEDKTVAVWDQRSRKIFKTITVNHDQEVSIRNYRYMIHEKKSSYKVIKTRIRLVNFVHSY